MFLWTSYVLLPRSSLQTRLFRSLKVNKHEILAFLQLQWGMVLHYVHGIVTSDFAGIYWEKLSPEKLRQIRILRELKHRIEQESGQMLPSGPSEKLPPTARRR